MLWVVDVSESAMIKTFYKELTNKWVGQLIPIKNCWEILGEKLIAT